MDAEKPELINADDANSNHSSNSQKSKASSRKRRTSENFDVIEVFEDETQLQDWFDNQEDGRDWVTEAKRETKTHQITEFICRLSSIHSGKQAANTQYNCQARLRIRRPLNLEAADQSIIVERTALDHEHKPIESVGLMETFEENKLLELMKNKNEADEKIREFTEKVTQIGEKVAGRFEEREEEEGEEMVDETVDETPESITNETIENADEKMSEKMEAEKTEELMKKEDTNEGQADQNLENSNKNAGEVEDLNKTDVKEEEVKEASSLAISSQEAQPASEQPQNSQEEEKQLAGRPKRHRARRLYSPEPPLRLGGEPRKKKEKSEDNVPNVYSTPSHQHFAPNIPNRILWAKEPPRQLHVEKPKGTIARMHEKKKSPIVKSTPMSSLFSQSASTGVCVPQTPNVVNLMRQNEKLTRELSQLKRQNQDQSKQIEALISANRELIWAFNESRKGHDELMRQLQLLTGTGGQLPNGNSQRKASSGIAGGSTFATTSSSKAAGAILQKRISGSTSVNQKKRYKSKPSEFFVPTDRPLPPSLAMLSKRQQQHQAAKLDSANSSVNEQLFANVKREIEEQEGEGWSDEGDVRDESSFSGSVQQQKKFNKEEELEKIKAEIEALPTVAGQEINKLLGQRRPPFYTPKEAGDWHMVIPGDLRRQIIYKLFQALCPEYKQQSIEEYLKAYPSRGDYIKNTMEFAFKTENELFVDAPSRDSYLQMISAKIFSLLETNNRLSDAGGEKQRKQRNTVGESAKKKKLRAAIEDQHVQ